MTTNNLGHDRSAAWCMGIPALLFAAVIAHHPTLKLSHDASVDDLVVGVSALAARNAAFHAMVLLMLGAQAIGLWSFADRLGLDRLVVRSGVCFYGIATVLLFVAGTVDGFAMPLLIHGSGAETGLSAGFAWIQAFTTVGLGTQALGLAFLSAALASGGQGRVRLAGLLGLPIALVPLALLMASDDAIGPSRLSLLVLPGCLCTLGAAVFLWTGALARARDAGMRGPSVAASH